MKKMSYYPACGKNGYTNPYSVNYKHAMSLYFDVLEADNKPPKYKMLGLYILKRSFQADVYVYNWIEDIGTYRLPLIQWLLVCLAFLIIKCRRKKIVWMFHNKHPHSGVTFYSKTISYLLFHTASLIVSHSKEAYVYAKSKTKRPTLYACHPIKKFTDEDLYFNGEIQRSDVFIWGSIIKYKGIEEFVSLQEVRKSNLKIHILGSGKDQKLVNRIRQYCGGNIVFEERRASYGEIAAYCRTSKFVLFPYVGDCVSSSGALIDTIAMGGTPVGPNIGAFVDLASENMCLTYKNYSDMIEILKSNKKIVDRTDFIDSNSWESFAKIINNILNKK